MTQNFLCFFLLDIFFLFVLHFLFLYNNKCPQVYIHHSLLVLCVIRSLLGRLRKYYPSHLSLDARKRKKKKKSSTEFISLWIPLSICIFKCVHFKGQFGWRGGKVDGWKTHLFGWREKGKDEKCNLYKLTIIHLLHNM